MLFRHWSPLCPQRQPNCPIKCCRHMFLQTMLTYWNFAFSLCCNFTFSVLLIWVWFRLKKHLVTHFVSLNMTEKISHFFSSQISLSVATITAGKYVKIPWFGCTRTGGNCPNLLSKWSGFVSTNMAGKCPMSYQKYLLILRQRKNKKIS